MFGNVYAHGDYAEEYAALDWGKTYLLIRRDLPGILDRHATGRRALDFGCGTGRSTRLLRACGFETTGVDIAPAMLDRALSLDPGGTYLLLGDEGLGALPPRHYDLVLAAFPFDNIPAPAKPAILGSLAQLLSPAGRFVNVVSSPRIYTHEWASFSTRDFPDNQHARDGDVVRIVTTDFTSGRPAEDILCTDEAYRDLYAQVGFEVEAVYEPLATGDEEWVWGSETTVAPWVIYVLAPRGTHGTNPKTGL